MNDYDLLVAATIVSILPQIIPVQGVEYDLVAQPEMYGQSYLHLSRLFEDEGIKPFNAVPLSTSLIPRHICIDTKILCQHVIGVKSKFEISQRKQEYWSEVFKLRHHAFKKRNGMTFNGFIRTDGISVSVLIEKENVKDQKRKRKRKPAAAPNASGYFQDNIQDLKENKVFIDPNRRDLLYCLGSNDEKLRYTSMQRRSETKAVKHDKIRSNIEVDAGLRGPVVPGPYSRVPSVSLPSSRTLNSDYFNSYLVNFCLAMNENESVYANVQFRKLKFSK